MSRKISNSEKIKKKYLSKLSVELIKRGISNNQIKSVLDEVALSLIEYIPDHELNSLEEIEQNFGSVKQFCDNNMLEFSREAAFGQIVYTSLILIGFITIISLGFASFFLHPYYWILNGVTAILLGVSIANMGAGFVGTLFGLNMIVWIIYKQIKNRFSKYDIRENAKKCILGLYWFISLVWFVQVILPYTIFTKVIADMLKQGMEFLVIEGIIRWLLLGSFLITTAVLYTKKYRENKQETVEKKYLIDNLKTVFIFFVLTGFIIPNPGIGTLVLFLGIGVLLLGKVTGETWILGTLAIATQVILWSLRLNHYAPVGTIRESGFRIIFGVKLTFNLPYRGNINFIIISIVMAILWTITCILIIRKQKERILPKFKIPNTKKLLQSLILLSIVGLATLGSQPQYTTIASGHLFSRDPPEPYGEIFISDSTFKIPAKGTIYFSIYTNMNLSRDYDDEYYILEGNWSVQFDYGPTYSGSFGNFSALTYKISNGEISINYFTFDVENSGMLKVHTEFNLSTFGGNLPFYDVIWVSPVPWFPSWLEIMVISVCFLSIFFTWEEPTVKKHKTKNKSEPKEHI